MPLNFATAGTLFDQGMALLRAGKPADAEPAFEQFVRENPSHWQAVYFWGIAALEQKKFNAAIERVGNSLKLNPQNPSAEYALADMCRQQNRHAEAIEHYDKCIALDPKCQGGYAHRAEMLVSLRRLDEAAASAQTAIRMTGLAGKAPHDLPPFVPSPQNPWNPAEILAIAAFVLGQVAQQRNQFDEALRQYRRVTELLPRHYMAWWNLAEIYFFQQKPVEALQTYDKLIELDPRRMEPYLNRGVVFARTGRFLEAGKMFEFVLAEAQKQTPPSRKFISTAFRLMGRSHAEWGDSAKAFDCYVKASEMNPNDAESHSCWLRTRTYLPGVDSAQWLTQHKSWWTKHAAGIIPMTHDRPVDPHKKLRIGLVSPDFRWHSVAYFLIALFEHFDTSRFEFYCYSNTDELDAFTDWFKAHATAWRDIQFLSDKDAADLVMQDRIDILIDLVGHTARNRLLLFAHKPAPVQATWLGCPSTTGSDLIDWRITDALSDPPGMTEPHYAEKLWRLNRPGWCFRAVSGNGIDKPNDQIPAPEIPATPRPFTFGSFAFNKTNPETFELWVSILKAAPNSRLFLKSKALSEPDFADQLRQRFHAKGIGPDQLVLQKYRKEGNDHLAMYHDIDLALDTYPYNGTTNTCEALWMGVPVVTLAGNVHHSRVGASLLSAVGLDSLIAKTETEYRDIAVRLATHPNELASLRKNLRTRLEQSPLMDAPGFTRDFCEALSAMWRDYAASHAKEVS